MPHALLIPGAWHSAESYRPLGDALAKHAITFDVLALPITARHTTTYQTANLNAATMHDYHAVLTAYLADKSPDIILLHSMAGAIFYSAPLGACAVPVLAIAAIIPGDGESIADVEGAAFSGRLQYVCRRRYSLLTPSAIADMYEGDKTNTPYNYSCNHLGLQPYRPFAYNMPDIRAHRADTCAHYVVCKTDKIIAPDHQRAYAHRIGARVWDMLWGHAPHASAPAPLAALTHDILQGAF